MKWLKNESLWRTIISALAVLSVIISVAQYMYIGNLQSEVENQQSMIEERDAEIKNANIQLSSLGSAFEATEAELNDIKDSRSDLLIKIQKIEQGLDKEKEHQFLRGSFVGCGVGLLAIGIPPEVSAEPCKAISEDLDEGDYWKKHIPGFDKPVGN